MTTKFYTAWDLQVKNLTARLAADLKNGAIASTDIVWIAADGSAGVAATPADLEEKEIEMTDSGTVAEYLSD